MSDFKKITRYQCTDCDKIYTYEPSKCSCKDILAKDKVVGSFKLVEPADDDKWHVICLICDNDVEIHRSNIRRQKSCGCKPKHIHILGITEKSVNYLCTKCTDTKVVVIPILEWCCPNGD